MNINETTVCKLALDMGMLSECREKNKNGMKCIK